MSARNRDDSAHRAIHDEIKAAHAAVMALDPDDESPAAHALGEAQSRAVMKIATLPLGGAGEFFVGLTKGDGSMVVHALWRNRRRVAQFEHRPRVLNEGWCIIVKPDEATAEREAARAAERERQRNYRVDLSASASFLAKHPVTAFRLAAHVEVGHLYDVPQTPGSLYMPGVRGGTVSFQSGPDEGDVVKVSARGLLRRACRQSHHLDAAVNALRALALQDAVRVAEVVACGLRADGLHDERVHQAERILDAIKLAHAAAKFAGHGWEARAFDALTQAGATAKPPTF